MQQGWSALLWFAAIIALIPLSLWLLKRTPLAGSGLGTPGTARTIAVLPLSTQHKLVTVEVGQGEQRQWLLLGLSPQGIHTLHTMAPQTAAPTAPPGLPQAPFAQMLSRLRGGGAGSGDAR